MIEGVDRPKLIETIDCPLGADGQPDVRAIVEIIRRLILDRPTCAGVEKIQAFGKDRGRRRGLQKLAANSQQWTAALLGVGVVNVIEPLPMQWMKTMIGSGLFGEANRKLRNEAIRNLALQMFLNAMIELIKHADRAVSILIADYCRRDYRIKAMAGLIS